MFSSSDIRREAREVLGGRFFGGEWLYGVLAVFLASAVSSVTAYIPFLGIVLAGPIGIGLAGYFMNRVRRRTPYDSLGVMIDSAKEDLGGNIVTGILSTLYTLFWSLLLIIPGIVKGISYSMAYYIKRDNPNLTASEAITKSRELMNGYKWKYFVLQLSFIGWYIVGFLCLGVGVLWANSLNATANAVFYERLMAQRNGYDAASSGEKPLWASVADDSDYDFTNPFSNN